MFPQIKFYTNRYLKIIKAQIPAAGISGGRRAGGGQRQEPEHPAQGCRGTLRTGSGRATAHPSPDQHELRARQKITPARALDWSPAAGGQEAMRGGHEQKGAGGSSSSPPSSAVPAATGHGKPLSLRPVSNCVFYMAKCALRGSARAYLARLSL